MGLDVVVVAVDDQQGTADPAIHRSANIVGGRNGPRLHGLGEHGAGRIGGPGEAVLDLLGRMRLGEDVANEVIGEVRIVRHPVRAIVFVPAVESLVLREEMLRCCVGIGRPDARRRADQDRRLHALGMIGRHHGGERAAEGQADEHGLARMRGIHDGQRVGEIGVERIGGDVVGPIGLAVAASVIGDAPEALAEIGELRLVDARMNDAPGRQEDDRLGAVAVSLPIELHAAAVDEAMLARELRAHGVTLSTRRLRHGAADRRCAAAPGAPARFCSRGRAAAGSLPR